MAVGVSQLGLFGSTVRGENTRKSDIDILIDFNADQETYLNFINACSILQSAFSLSIIGEATKKIPADVKYAWQSISWESTTI